MSLIASKINLYAHQISAPIQECPKHEYCTEVISLVTFTLNVPSINQNVLKSNYEFAVGWKVARLERMLGTQSLGLTGLGCATITREFMLMILSVIFTLEIVLLQTSSAGTKQ